MAKAKTSYDSVKHSGVSSQENPGAGTSMNSYSKASKSGVAVSSQPEAPPFPEDTPSQNKSYNQLKN